MAQNEMGNVSQRVYSERECYETIIKELIEENEKLKESNKRMLTLLRRLMIKEHKYE